MLNVGIVQMESKPLRVEENLTLAGRLIAQAAADGAQLVVLPELFNVGYCFGDELMDVAETLDGRTVDWLRAQAAKHNTYVTASLFERHERHFYNTMVMVGSDGSVQSYRKRNPTVVEMALWRRGDMPGPGVSETPSGRIGGAICFDSFALETFEGFRRSAVDLVILVACWGGSRTTPSRPELAMGNRFLQRWARLASEVVPYEYATQLGVPTVFVNQGGTTNSPLPRPRLWPFPSLPDVEYAFLGRSRVLDASGGVLVQATGSEVAFHAVAAVDVRARGAAGNIDRVDYRPRYLSTDYYFVQPPCWQ
jgi:predicted amidohydrolase